MNLIFIGLLCYVFAQITIGIIIAKGIRTEEDYLLAGRRIGYWLATFSFFATWFGAETCIGSAGAIYQRGLSGGSADPFGYGVCMILMGIVFARRLWQSRLTTLADLFRIRYSKGVEWMVALFLIPTSLLWTAAQVRAFAQILSTISGLQLLPAISISAVVAIIYTGLGGMRADIITDLLQGIMLILGLVILFIAAFPKENELMTTFSSIDKERLNIFSGYENVFEGLEDWLIPICGSITAQELVARVLATKSGHIAQASAITGGLLYIIVGLIPVSFGIIGPYFFPNLDHPEQILPAIAQKYLPPFLFILFAGALVSAILSTVDSTLLAAGSLTAHNIVIPLITKPTEEIKVRISRICVVIYGVIAWAMALKAESILHLVENASSFGTAGIFVIMVLGLFTNFGSSACAYTALILGTGVWILASISDVPYPYLSAITSAFVGYSIIGLIEKIRISRFIGL